MVSLAFALLSGQTFGASGFLESRDQLWFLQSVPNGPSTYVKARLVQAVVLLIPCALLPSIMLTVTMELVLLESLMLFIVPFVVGVGSAMVAIGITASSPIYDDANSAALKGNISKFMTINILSFMTYNVIDLVLGIVFGLGVLTQAIYSNTTLYMLAMFSPLPLVGIVVLVYGIRRFSSLE